MRDKLYTFTKSRIVCVRISDDELENVEKLMERTNKSASEIMRRSFLLMVERLNETEIIKNASS